MSATATRTMRQLEERVAALLGKEAALFFPSGVMANQAAVWLHAPRGTGSARGRRRAPRAQRDRRCRRAERRAGAAGAPLRSRDDRCRSAGGAAGPASRYYPAAPSLVSIENTHNGAGGKITPMNELAAIRAVAQERGLPVHMDGARIWNASVASGVPTADIANCAETVMVAFSSRDLRRAGRRCVGGNARRDRNGVDRAQTLRRRDAAIGNSRRGRAVRARSSCRPTRRRPRQRPVSRHGVEWRCRRDRRGARYEYRDDRSAAWPFDGDGRRRVGRESEGVLRSPEWWSPTRVRTGDASRRLRAS